MLFRLKLFGITITSSCLLLLFLCLGSQNLSNRHTLNLGITKTAPLPSGFIVGLSFTIGMISGGFTNSLIREVKKPFSD